MLDTDYVDKPLMKTDILESLQTQILLSDGSIGTELQKMGLEPGALGELWNVDHPERIQSLHRAYLEAGSRLLTTNSFRGNRLALSQYGLEARIDELNRAAATLAREAAAGRAWVMGSLGPFGGFLEPLGDTRAEEVFDVFREQARALLGGGSDLILIETMSSAEEMDLAIRAAREAGAAVVFATMTFAKVRDGFRTMMGVSPQQAAEVMDHAGADVIGCNCGTALEMEDHEQIVRALSGFTSKPIIVQPNAGQPELVGTEIVYRRTPEGMAVKVPALIRAGARVVGGCCGTTPEHIRLFDEELKKLGDSSTVGR
ncbi:MAG: homocysteine S-methyltransferase family protein [Acidobacteriia bacterium]|nr:homocysteine S-methyltransferase family protein [Terriglobia bacterium]